MLETVSAPQAIVDYVLKAIREGRYQAGEKLPSERKLMAELGVGRLALREAMARLTALGITRIEHGRGAFVQRELRADVLAKTLVPLSAEPENQGDLLEARVLLEEGMAARAARVRSEADLDELEGLLQAGEAVVNDPVALAKMDLAFHQVVGRISGNVFLAVLHDALSEHIRTFLEGYTTTFANGREVVRRHQPILEAIRRQDETAARQAVRSHIALCQKSAMRKDE